MSINFEREAKGRLKIAILRMAKSYPFHTHLLQSNRFRYDQDVDTIGVTIRDFKLQFLYSPAFVCACEFEELTGLLHHMVNHVLFEHLLVEPEAFSDREARTIAEEVTVNEWIKEPLPGDPITLEQFPDLPKGEDTDTRYTRLAGKSAVLSQKTLQTGRKTVPNVPKTVQNEPKNGCSGENSGRKTLDNHDVWKQAQENPILGKLVVQHAVRQAKHALDERDWDALPDDIRRHIDTVLAGSTSKNSTERIHGGKAGLLDWKSELRRFVARATESQPSLHRVPRRFPELVGIIPGKSYSPNRLNIISVIDTSVSMTTDLLDQIGGELRILSRDCNITVVECDTEIRSVYRFQREITKVHGRGGTDLRPPFERKFLSRHQADALIYFTDGHGPAPDKPARIPTLWCLTPSGVPPAEWGKVTSMRNT